MLDGVSIKLWVEALLKIVSCLVTLLGSFSFVSACAADIIGDANRFTVQILAAVEYSFREEFTRTPKYAGFLIDRVRGWIMTNAHVACREPARIRVNFKRLKSTIVERLHVDAHFDIATILYR